MILTLGACSKKEQPAPAQQPVQAAVTAPKPAAPAPPAPAADELKSEYQKADALLDDHWWGSGATLEAAKNQFTALLEKDRNFAPAYTGLARVEFLSGYFRGDEFDSTALARASKLNAHALELDPNFFDAHILAGYLARYSNDYDLARASFDRAGEIGGIHHADVLLGRAELADAENDSAAMVALAKQTIAGSYDLTARARAYGYLIDAYGMGGHNDQVDAAYREQLKARPDVAWFHGNYAGFLLRRGDVDGAVREAETAIRIDPYPIGMRTLARALLAKANQQWESGQYAEAGKTIERMAPMAGDDPALCASLGSFYEAAAIRSRDAAMRARALEWYRKALALAPEDRELQRVVARLDRRVQ